MRGLHHALAERRVRVDREADVLEERVHLERERALADEVARLGADDVDAEDLVRLLVGDDLDEALGLVDRHRAAERGEGELADAHLDALLLRLRLGETGDRDLRIGEDRGGDRRPSPSPPCDRR